MSDTLTLYRSIPPNDLSDAPPIHAEIEIGEAVDNGGIWVTLSNDQLEAFSAVFIENRLTDDGKPGVRIHVWTASDVDGGDPAFIIDPLNEQYAQYQPLERIEG
ncbi:hypothetical protein [Aggregatilinea lenta]|uniref:hypothetical protein n=1 Tax=Aggregatilinea lenta TaxID=913108 RepID=UPI000E5A510F|nr:hypothetical protein [Aggregatilinea lenta]